MFFAYLEMYLNTLKSTCFYPIEFGEEASTVANITDM